MFLMRKNEAICPFNGQVRYTYENTRVIQARQLALMDLFVICVFTNKQVFRESNPALKLWCLKYFAISSNLETIYDSQENCYLESFLQKQTHIKHQHMIICAIQRKLCITQEFSQILLHFIELEYMYSITNFKCIHKYISHINDGNQLPIC